MAALFILGLLMGGGGLATLLVILGASILGLVDVRVSIAVGLLCLASYPVLVVADHYAWLQQSSLVNYFAANIGIYSLKSTIDAMMTLAFYFLGIGLLGLITRYIVRRQGVRSEHV